MYFKSVESKPFPHDCLPAHKPVHLSKIMSNCKNPIRRLMLSHHVLLLTQTHHLALPSQLYSSSPRTAPNSPFSHPLSPPFSSYGEKMEEERGEWVMIEKGK